MASEISKSIQFICDEKGLDYATVMEAIEMALGAAYRKDFGHRQQNIKTKFDPETSDMKMWDVKEVVEDVEEEVLEKAQEELAERREKAFEEGKELTDEDIADLPRFNPKTEMMITEAKEVKKDAEIGDTLEIELEIPGDFGRMAAQTAKQVVIQKLREAERSSVFDDFKEQEGKIVHGIVQRKDRMGNTIVDFGKITGILPQTEQVARDFYKPGVRMRFFVLSVEMGQRGPEIILSRSHVDMVKTVFAQEIPEIENGEVTIKDIARDAGSRSKVAVWTDDESIDPIGSCIGQRGGRISIIIDELGGEKIDVIQYNDNAEQYISQALSPAKVSRVDLDEGKKIAKAHVAEDQFSLAIGRGGQNVRLAAELTGWEIKVIQIGGEEKEISSEDSADEVEGAVLDKKEEEKPAEASSEDGVEEVAEEKEVVVEEVEQKEGETKKEE